MSIGRFINGKLALLKFVAKLGYHWLESWWRYQMEHFSALLAICARYLFDLRLNKRLSKQSWGWWFETISCPLWRHCNDNDSSPAGYLKHFCLINGPTEANCNNSSTEWYFIRSHYVNAWGVWYGWFLVISWYILYNNHTHIYIQILAIIDTSYHQLMLALHIN